MFCTGFCDAENDIGPRGESILASRIALYIAANFIYLSVLPLMGSAQGSTILERGIQYAAEDRVGTAVMSQMFGSLGGWLMAGAILISSFGCANS